MKESGASGTKVNRKTNKNQLQKQTKKKPLQRIEKSTKAPSRGGWLAGLTGPLVEEKNKRGLEKNVVGSPGEVKDPKPVRGRRGGWMD